jgi:hypothetical protein
MLRSTSPAVAPVATQPGRSGTYAEKFDAARSMTTAYRMTGVLLSYQEICLSCSESTSGWTSDFT